MVLAVRKLLTEKKKEESLKAERAKRAKEVEDAYEHYKNDPDFIWPKLNKWVDNKKPAYSIFIKKCSSENENTELDNKCKTKEEMEYFVTHGEFPQTKRDDVEVATTTTTTTTKVVKIVDTNKKYKMKESIPPERPRGLIFCAII